MITVQPETLTQDGFDVFGSVVTTPKGVPTSEAQDYKFWSDLAHYAISGETEIGICTVFRQVAPIVSGMERHSRTPEILIPIDAPFDLPLLLDGRSETETKAFRVNPGQAVVIREGVWHGACLPVAVDRSSYFVIFRRGTPHEDVKSRSIQPLEIRPA